TWAMEQSLMRHVEEGNLDYQEIYGKIAITGSNGDYLYRNPSLHHKTNVLVLIVLCSRAAMRAGLSPELAYTLSDYYIANMENADSIAELQTISHTMYHDYTLRVHDMLANTQISRPIQECCNYIQLHSAEKLEIADIAAQIGYAEYYFSKKFKKEVGMSVKDYIKEAKVNRAKIMLRSGISISEVTDTLNFSSQSYFTEIFRKLTGVTPAEYRDSVAK
ncbi:MAG: AraC family transcriptional regulator, partial [Lachnospiraceae bacterium]|nr:AraC family transcriptional regulator [Lachnospiraceae bacterium]